MGLIARNLNTGAIVASNVAVADTRATRAVGLLTRDGLNPGEALWIVPSRGVHTCWMRFTIDVVALDDQGVVLGQVRDHRWRRTAGSCPPRVAVLGVAIDGQQVAVRAGQPHDDRPVRGGHLEVEVGQAALERRHGLRFADQVREVGQCAVQPVQNGGRRCR